MKFLNFLDNFLEKKALDYHRERRQPCPAVEVATVAAALAAVVITTILAIPPKKIAPLPLSEETGKNHFPRRISIRMVVVLEFLGHKLTRLKGL